jgi:beta-lactamase regulating signal transducer with metallopeptidase domain
VVGGLVATGWQIAGVLRLRRALRDCAVVSGRANQLGTGEKACELVVVPEPRVVALTVPGRPDRIVVSTGLRERLPRTEFDAVLRHEQAHLSLRHARVLLFAVALMATVGRLPPVRRSIDALRGALEVWADEAAAGDDRSQRGTLRSALLRIAAEPSAIRTVGGAGLMVSSRADALAGAATIPTSGGSLATIGALAVRGLVAVPLLLVILHAWQVTAR